MAKKILVVDDEPDVRESIKIVLEKNGYDVAEAPNGKSALSLIGKQNFDLVILDVMMPEMSGWDTMTKLIEMKKEYRKKIIFLSVVQISDERKKQLLVQGALDYVQKPFDINELIKKVKGALG